MGLLSSISKIGGGLLTKAQGVVGAVSGKVAGVAAKIDQVIPHPANGGLENVVRVISAPFSGGKVNANVSNPTLKKALELVSNNPLKTALVGAGAVSAARVAIPAAGKAVSKFKSVPTPPKPSGIIKPSGGGGILQPSTTPPSALTTPGGMITPTTAGVSSRATGTRKKRTASRKKKTSRRKSRTRKTRRTSKRRYGTQAQYNRPGGKKVYKTKNGQPYILLNNGKALFIKRSRR